MRSETNVGLRAVIGLGTATFLPGYGLGASAEGIPELGSLIRKAVERGVRYIDTAQAYGHGEAMLGELSDLLTAKHVRLCTKLASSGLLYAVEASLQRLRQQTVDTLLLHSARDHELTDPLVSDALVVAKESRLAHRVGASTYGVGNAMLALGQPWCDVLQVEYSIVNPSVLRAVLEYKRSGQEIVVRSVLCKGLLTSRRHRALHLAPIKGNTLDRLEAQATDWGYTIEELAIRFALDSQGIDVVLIGLNNLTELETALAAAGRKPLQAWQLEALGEYNCADEDWSHPERWQVSA